MKKIYIDDEKWLCGNCVHYQKRQGKHGECCKDTPKWCNDLDFSSCPPWFVMEDEDASECDCYRQKGELK